MTLVLLDGRSFVRRASQDRSLAVPDPGGSGVDDAIQLVPLGSGIGAAGGLLSGHRGSSSVPSDDLAAPTAPLGVLLEPTDDRRLVGDEATLTGYPGRTIGALSGSSTGGTGCTGTMVGPRHVLTNAHCVHDNMGNWPAPIFFAPGQQGGDQLNGNPRRMIARYARTFALDADYALIILEDRPETAALGWMGMGWYSSLSTYDDKTVFNSGYPLSGQDCAASPNTDGTCGGFMYGDTCGIAEATDGYILYDCDTTGGHSGSPVWRYWGNDPVILGVHKRGNEASSGAVITANPPTLNLGPRLRPAMYDDLCTWMREWPSAFANHSVCS